MPGRESAGDELYRWARELADRIRDIVEESISVISPELERLAGRGSLEKDDFLYIKLALPGCRRDSISVSVRDKVVEVVAQSSEAPFPEAWELQPSKKQIRRVVHLPKEVIPEKSEAKYVDGILYLKLKIAEEKGVVIKVE